MSASPRTTSRRARRRLAVTLTRRVLTVLVGMVLIATGLVTLAPVTPAAASVRQSFNPPVYSADENGAIAIVGNAQMTCTTSVATCAAARSGTAATAGDNNNNAQIMNFVDIDTSSATTNSTSADLNLPAGSTVLYARLVWGGRQLAGSNGVAATGALNEVLLQAPGQTGYTTLTGTVFTDAALNTGTDGGVYQGALDITQQVRAAGSGTYFVGNIKAATGQDRYAGWSLVVAYQNPALPLRNLSIFSGFADVTTTSTANSTVTIPVSGFRTPANGTVNASVGFVAWEGDGGTTGDFLQFNGSTLSDGVRPANNYFTSRISTLGAANTARNPNTLNTFGVDMGTSNANGLLTNGQTSTNITVGTQGDYFYPGLITTQIDLFSPKFPEVTKTVTNLNGNAPAQPGDILEYSVSYPNSGGDTATNVVMNDQLATGLTYLPGSMQVTAGPNQGVKTDASGDDQADYTAANRTVTMRLGTGATALTGGALAPGASTTVKFRATVNRSASGTTVDNVARLSYTALTLGNSYTFTGNVVSTPVNALAELQISKTSDPVSQNAGSRVTYQLAVTNNGPNAATNVVVTDTLPAGAGFVSAISAGWTCAASGQTVTCRNPSLANGANVTIPVVVDVAPSTAAGTLVNRATVTSDTADDVTVNNSSTASTTVTRAADIAVTLTGPATANAGSNVTWTATITNNGPSTATATTLNDLLPGIATFVSATASGGGTCTNTNNQVDCAFGDLAPGQSRTVTVIGRLDAAAPTGTISNTATGATTTPDPNTQNNSASVATQVNQSADLQVTKAATTPSVVAGTRARYSVTVRNAGPSAAAGVVVTDPPISGYTITGANPSQGTCTVTNGSVRCELGSIGPDGTVTIAILGDVDTTRAAGPLTNTAAATTTTPESTTGNNSGSGTVTVTVSADASLVKTGPAQFTAGQTGTYTLSVGNSGPSRATGAQVTDTLPASLTFVSSASGCTAAGQQVTCPVGTVAVGDTVTRSFVVRASADLSPAATVSNTATLSTTSPDPVATNNTATFVSSAEARADLSLTKTTSPARPVAGTNVTYTLTGTNAGPSNATGVVITDTLPAGVSFVSGTVTGGGACTANGQDVSCPVGALNADATVTATIVAAVAPTTLNSTSNTARIAAATPDDPTLSNNSATSNASVITSADLGVTFTPLQPTVAAGERVTYQLSITNNGPSVARNSVVTGRVPDNLTPVRGSSLGQCTVSEVDAARTVICPLGTINVGQTITFTFQADVNTNAPAGNVTGTASVGSTATDPVPGNDNATATIQVVNRADLVLDKSVSPSPLVAGTTATYLVTVDNQGPSDATDVEITDALPAGLSIRSVVPSVGTCDVGAGNQITCDIPRLTADATVTVAVVVDVAAGAGGTISNTASVESPTPDPVLGDNTDTVAVTVQASADLRMIKTVDSPSVAAGTAVRYTLDVVNAGPSNATAVEIEDQLPAGLTILPNGIQAAAGVNCSASTTTTVDCTVGTLAPGASAVVTVTALAAAGTADGTVLTNTATVSSPTAGPTDGDPRTDSATVTVVARADVSVTKSAVIDPPTAGLGARWQLTATNNGPSTATAVVLTDTLPEGATFTSATPAAANCTADGRTVTCALGTVAPGATVAVTLDAALSPGLAGRSLVNTASVATATTDTNPTNDTTTQTSTVAGLTDLEVTKTVSSGPVVAGQNVTYALSVDNIGPSDTTAVRLVDTLPAGVRYVSSAASGGECSVSGQTVTCTWPTLTVAQAALTAAITVAVPADADGRQGLDPLVNSAAATSANPDPNPAPATVSSPIAGSADLRATKSLLEAPVAGESVRWQVQVSNAGPSDATGVTLRDVAPAGVTFTGAQTPQGSCDVTAGLVDCALGRVNASSAISVTVVGTLDPDFAGTTLTNQAVVASDVTDPVPANNTGSATSPVQTAADLSIVKIAEPTTATAGQALTYRLTVANAGPSTSTGVLVTDTLPVGFVAGTPTVPGGTCELVGRDLRCEVPSLADGATVTVTVPGTVTAAFAGPQVSNTAGVESDTEDPNRANDTARLDTAVQTSADLVVSATGPDTVVAGAPITWQVTVTNNGPSDAAGVVLADVVPAGVTGVRAVAGTQLCSIDGGTVSCPVGSLPVGQSVTIQIIGTVDPGLAAGTQLVTTATGSTTTTDPVAANNTAQVTTAVITASDLTVTKTADTETFTAGTPVSWTVVVANSGPSVARAVTLNDEVPATVGGVTARTTAGQCSVTGQVVDCDLADVPANGRVTVIVSGVLDADTTDSSVFNAVAVASPTTDPTPADRVADATTDIVASADLRISKRVVGLPVAGDPLGFEILVTNDGPSTARGVVVTDTVPEEVTPTSADVPGGDCTIAGQTVTCTVDAVTNGQTVTVTVAGTVAPDFDGDLTNVATVSADTPDPRTVGNTTDVTFDVDTSSDLTLTKTGPASVVAGEEVSWTLTLGNGGPSTATGVEVLDAIPAGLLDARAVSDRSEACTADGSGSLTCAIGSLAVGEDVVITVTGTVPASYGAGPLTNLARATGTSPDPDSTNSTAVQTVAVTTQADVSIDLSADPTSLVAGGTGTVRATVTNLGPSDAGSVTVSVPLPPGVILDGDATVAGGTCSVVADVVTCDLGTIPAGGEPLVISIPVRVLSNYTAPTVPFSGSVATSTTDPTTANNIDTLGVPVTRQADLRIAKTGPARVVAGQPLAWQITVGNNGPSSAQDVGVTDTLPAGLGPVTITTSQGECTVAGRELTCDLGDLPARSSVTIDVVVTDGLPAGYATGPISNTATVSSPTAEDPGDTGPGDRSSDPVVTVVVASADVNVSKVPAGGATSFTAGGPASWTITVDNDGPSVARNVVLTDLGARGVTGLTFTEVPNGITCTGLRCVVGDIDPGEVLTFTVTGTVEPGNQTAFVSNGARLTTPAGAALPNDPNPGDNEVTSSVPLISSADLSVAKSAPQSVVAGESIEWVVTVTNTGPSVARDVRVGDTLPAGITVTGYEFDEDVFTRDGATFAADDLPAGSYEITIRATVSPDYDDDTIDNSVSVSAATADADATNNAADTRTGVTTRADVEVTKTGPATAVPGQSITWELTVTNTAGPSVARDVVLTDVVPAEVTGIQASDESLCEIVEGTITCELGDLAVGDERVVTLTGTIDPGATGSLSNTAVLGSGTPDPDTDNDTDTVTTTLEPSADVSVVKSVDPETLVAGEPALFTLTVANAGPSVARGVSVTDVVDPDLDITQISTTGGACDQQAGAVICELGDLAPGADPVTVTIAVAVPPGYEADAFANTAQVSSSTPDPETEDNTSTVNGPVAARADLTVTKVADRDEVSAGERITWTITVDNDGPTTARRTTVVDNLPAGVTLVSATGTGATCEQPTQPDGSVVCALGDLEPDATRTVTLVGLVAGDYTGTSVTNTAQVSSLAVDENPADNTVTVQTDTVTTADVSVVKTVDPGSLEAGEPATFTLTVRNAGPSVARDVRLTDVVDPALGTPTVEAPTGVVCTETDGVVDCDLGDLAAGADPVVVTLTVDVPPGYDTDTFANTAQVSSASPDPQVGNNTSTVNGPAAARADLNVTKTADRTEVRAGQQITWTIAVANEGPATARQATVVDNLPAGVALVSATGDGVTCTPAATPDAVVVCALGDVVPDGTRTVTLVGAVSAEFTGSSVVNTAQVSSRAVDENPADNTATAGTPVVPTADVSVVKTVDPNPIQAGEPATFSIRVSNAGPRAAEDVTVLDAVDRRLTVTGVTTTAGTCVSPDGQVSCELGDLAPDADPTVITVTVDVPPGYDSDTFANSATATSVTEDPNPANNTGTVAGPAAARADLEVTKTAETEQALPGGEVAWTIVVGNDGPATARDAVVVDDLPEGVTLRSITGDDVTCADPTAVGGTVTCALGDLAPGQERTLRVVGVLDTAATATEIVNVATVGSSAVDPDTGNNVARSAVPVTPPPTGADLTLAKQTVGDLVAGERGTWRLTLTNQGPAVARGVVLTDALPAGLTDVRVAEGCALTGRAVTCAVADLEAGDTVTVDISALIPSDATGSITNRATVTSDTVDSDLDDNTAGVTSPVGSVADLGVIKTIDRINVGVGDQVTWTVRVTNDGPSTARDVVVAEAWPDGVQLLDSEVSQGRFDPASGRWTIGTLASGTSVELRVTGRLDEAGEVRNRVTVSSSSTDPDTDNDVASSSVEVEPESQAGEPPVRPDEPGTPHLPGLPGTGGPALGWLGLGVLIVVAGAFATAFGVRRRRE